MHRSRAFISPLNLTPEDSVRFLAWLDRERRPLHAIVFPFDVTNTLSRLPSRWQVVTRIRQAKVWRRTSPQP